MAAPFGSGAVQQSGFMPNVRSSDKVIINAWLPRALMREVERVARVSGKGKSQLVIESLEREVARRKKNLRHGAKKKE